MLLTEALPQPYKKKNDKLFIFLIIADLYMGIDILLVNENLSSSKTIYRRFIMIYIIIRINLYFSEIDFLHCY